MTKEAETVKPGHLQERQDALEKRLQSTFKERKELMVRRNLGLEERLCRVVSYRFSFLYNDHSE